MFHAVLSRAVLWWITAIYWPDFATFTYPSPIWRHQYEEDSLELSGSYLVWKKLEWLGYNLMKVAWWSTQSFGWAQYMYINLTDRQTDWQTDSHVAIADAAATHFAFWLDTMKSIDYSSRVLISDYYITAIVSSLWIKSHVASGKQQCHL